MAVKRTELQRLQRLGYTKIYTYDSYMMWLKEYKMNIVKYKSNKSAKQLRRIKTQKDSLVFLRKTYKIIGGTRKLPVIPVFKK